MNKLSWLLYVGGIIENVGMLLVVFGFVAIILAIAAWCAYGQALDNCHGNDSKPSPKTAMQLTPLFAIFWLLAAAVPNRETVYAIAASEMGEQMLKTPLATKAEKALEAWLDKQIAVNQTAEPKAAEQQ